MGGRSADRLRAVGTVKEVLPSALYRVELASGESILAHVATEMRLRAVRILPGDTVTVELSPYDMSRGRLVEQAGRAVRQRNSSRQI